MIIYVSSQNRFQQRFAVLKELVKVLKIFSQFRVPRWCSGAGPQGFHPGQSSTASSCGVPPQSSDDPTRGLGRWFKVVKLFSGGLQNPVNRCPWNVSWS